MDTGGIDKVERLEEVLPGIEDFLTNVLSKEKLSKSAEEKRLRLVEHLEIIHLPPTLPPRPDGKPGVGRRGIDEVYLAHQRELSRTNPAAKTNAQSNGQTIIPDEPDDEAYDDVDIVDSPSDNKPSNGHPQDIHNVEDEDLYEVPTGQGHSDDEEYNSSTSYESYDDDEDEYVNGEFQSSNSINNLADKNNQKNQRQKPRKKRKAKDAGAEKEKSSTLPNSVCAKNLPNIQLCGELHQLNQKWKIGKWSKRFCVIAEGHFYCFKGDKDIKPLVDFPLLKYDVIYLEKEEKRNHVIRMSYPGAETHLFSGNSKDKVDLWIEYMSNLSKGKDMPLLSAILSAETDSGVSVGGGPGEQSSVSSEGGSGDGTIQATSPKQAETEGKPTAVDKKKTGLMNLLNFSLGRKKGEKVKKHSLLDFDEAFRDPSALISGYLEVSPDIGIKKAFVKRWCMVKREGTLECYLEPGQQAPEYSFPLDGCTIQPLGEKSLGLKLIQEGIEKIAINYSDPIQQGQWLNLFIRLTGFGKSTSTAPMANFEGMEDYDSEVYDEVYDHQTSVVDFLKNNTSTGSGGSSGSSSSNAKPSVTGSTTTTSTGKVPPPLPANPPPVRSNTMKVSSEFDNNYINQEDEDIYDEAETPPALKQGPMFGKPLPPLPPPGNDSENDECFYDDTADAGPPPLPSSPPPNETQGYFNEADSELVYENTDSCGRHLSEENNQELPNSAVAKETKIHLENDVVSDAVPLNTSDMATSDWPDDYWDDETPSNVTDNTAVVTDETVESMVQNSIEKDTVSEKPVVVAKPPVLKPIANKKPAHKPLVDDKKKKPELMVKPSAVAKAQKMKKAVSEKPLDEPKKSSESDNNERRRSDVGSRNKTWSGSSGAPIINKAGPQSKTLDRMTQGQQRSQSVVAATRPTIQDLVKEEDDSLVKCHQGPTIEQDRDILAQTENPILSQLRREKSVGGRKNFRGSEKDKMEEEASELRRKLAQIRKKRAEVRSRKLSSSNLSEKRELEDELKKLTAENLETDQKLTSVKAKLTEMGTISVSLEKKDSFSSRTSSGSNSPRGTASPVFNSSAERFLASTTTTSPKTSYKESFEKKYKTAATPSVTSKTDTSAKKPDSGKSVSAKVSPTSNSAPKTTSSKSASTTPTSPHTPQGGIARGPVAQAQAERLGQIRAGRIGANNKPKPQPVKEKLKLWEEKCNDSVC